MSSKTIRNLLLIALLLFGFARVWIFNQRLNYRKVLTLDTKLLLNGNLLNSSDLSSPTHILRYLNENGMCVTLEPRVIMSSEYEALGRELVTDNGNILVYEYEQPKHALKKLEKLTASGVTGIYSYKNLIILDKTVDGTVPDLISKMQNENL